MSLIILPAPIVSAWHTTLVQLYLVSVCIYSALKCLQIFRECLALVRLEQARHAQWRAEHEL